MTEYLKEWKNVTLGAMSGDLPTVIDALEGSVERAEVKSRNVVDFREAADFYHGDNREYIYRKLRRVISYLRQNENEADFIFRQSQPLDWAALDRKHIARSARYEIENILAMHFAEFGEEAL